MPYILFFYTDKWTFITTWKGELLNSSQFLQKCGGFGRHATGLQASLLLPCWLCLALRKSCVYTCVDFPVCMFKFPSCPCKQPLLGPPSRRHHAYIDCMISSPEDGPRKGTCADPGSGCGTLGVWNSGTVEMWGLDSGSQLIIGMQTTYLMEWGAAGRVPEWGL